MANARVVLTTVGDKESADNLALHLVERRLAACVNIVGPMQSVYRWQGKMERAEEYLLVVKTTAEQASRVETVFKQMHPYNLPEHLELSVEGGSEAYLQWIAGEVGNE